MDVFYYLLAVVMAYAAAMTIVIAQGLSYV